MSQRHPNEKYLKVGGFENRASRRAMKHHSNEFQCKKCGRLLTGNNAVVNHNCRVKEKINAYNEI